MSKLNNYDLLLREIEYDNNTIVELVFSILESTTAQYAQWSVAVTNTTSSPIKNFSSYDAAVEELHRRCGEVSLQGASITRDKRYAEIKGSIFTDDTKKNNNNFIIRKILPPTPVTNKEPNQTLRLDE